MTEESEAGNTRVSRLVAVAPSRQEMLSKPVTELFVYAGFSPEVAESAAKALVLNGNSYGNDECRYRDNTVGAMLQAAKGSFAENTVGGRALFNAFYKLVRYNEDVCRGYRSQVVAAMQRLGLLDDKAKVAEGVLPSAATSR